MRPHIFAAVRPLWELAGQWSKRDLKHDSRDPVKSNHPGRHERCTEMAGVPLEGWG